MIEASNTRKSVMRKQRRRSAVQKKNNFNNIMRYIIQETNGSVKYGMGNNSLVFHVLSYASDGLPLEVNKWHDYIPIFHESMELLYAISIA